jgi:hypothetical protein
MELIMTVVSRKSFVEKMLKKSSEVKNKSSVVKNKSSFNNPNLTKFYDRYVLEVTEDWRTIKCGGHKMFPFGENRSNVWNHEWSEQFVTYSHNEWRESNSLTNNSSFWSEEVSDLISEHKDDFDSDEEYESRLNECLEISNKYN